MYSIDVIKSTLGSKPCLSLVQMISSWHSSNGDGLGQRPVRKRYRNCATIAGKKWRPQRGAMAFFVPPVFQSATSSPDIATLDFLCKTVVWELSVDEAWAEASVECQVSAGHSASHRMLQTSPLATLNILSDAWRWLSYHVQLICVDLLYTDSWIIWRSQIPCNQPPWSVSRGYCVFRTILPTGPVADAVAGGLQGEAFSTFHNRSMMGPEASRNQIYPLMMLVAGVWLCLWPSHA